MRRHGFRDVLIVIIALFGCACTDVDVRRLWLHNRISLQGHFCTEDPQQVVTPIKVLFAIDSSSSLAITDTDFARSDAVRETIDRFRPYRQVSFGIIRWASDRRIDRAPEVCTYAGQPCTQEIHDEGSAFTKDRVILDGAILSSQQVGGQKPYTETLDLIRRLIESDVRIDSELASNTKYLVIWFTDGAPCPAEDRQMVLDKVEELKLLGEENTAKLMLHTALLDLWTDPEPGCINAYDADEILRDMSETGQGRFERFASPDEIDFIPFVQDELSTNFELVQVIVENRSARLMVLNDHLIPVADSDGDGLPDMVEESLGTSPVMYDSDGDGCGDKLEVEREGFDPLAPGMTADPGHCYCPKAERTQDSDGDGLLDCEEFFLGTNKHRYDSDSDLLPDGLEHRGGSKPAESNLGIFDHDEDGASDWEEVWLHRLPGVVDDGLEPLPVDHYTYRYQVQQDGAPVGGVTCYSFDISNIVVMATAGSDYAMGPQEGQNDIEVSFVQIPRVQSDDDPGAQAVTRVGHFQQFFFEPALMVPNREFIPVLPTDLVIRR